MNFFIDPLFDYRFWLLLLGVSIITFIIEFIKYRNKKIRDLEEELRNRKPGIN